MHGIYCKDKSLGLGGVESGAVSALLPGMPFIGMFSGGEIIPWRGYRVSTGIQPINHEEQFPDIESAGGRAATVEVGSRFDAYKSVVAVAGKCYS